jgi:Arc/MetJ-type ribon-helix-helix transcriptional regulator
VLRTQVYLTEQQDQGLKRLAKRSGRSQSQLIRDAIDRLIESEPQPDWKAALRSAAGIWADRPEIDAEMREIREGLKRRHERLERHWRRS